MKKVTIKIGKRNWAMTVSRTSARGIILKSKSGNEYLLWNKGSLLTRHADVPRVLTWVVTGMEGLEWVAPTLAPQGTTPTVKDAVRVAYQGLAYAPNAHVDMADLTSRLAAYTDAEVKAAIAEMCDEGVASLTATGDVIKMSV